MYKKLFACLFLFLLETMSGQSMDVDSLVDRLSKPLEYSTLSVAQRGMLHNQGEKLLNEYCNYLAQRAAYHAEFHQLLTDIKGLSETDRNQSFSQIYGYKNRDTQHLKPVFYRDCIAQALEDHEGWYRQFAHDMLAPLLGQRDILASIVRLKDTLSEGATFYQQNTQFHQQNESELRRQMLKATGAQYIKSDGLLFFSRHTFKENADFISDFSCFLGKIHKLLDDLKFSEHGPSVNIKSQNKPKSKGGKTRGGKKNGQPKKKATQKGQSSKGGQKTSTSVSDDKGKEEAGESQEIQTAVTIAATTQQATPGLAPIEADTSPAPCAAVSKEEIPQSPVRSLDELIGEWIGELEDGRVSIDNYHKRVHEIYAQQKFQRQVADGKEDDETVVQDKAPMPKRLARNQYEVLRGIFEKHNSIRWDTFVTMIKSLNGLNGEVLTNKGGSSATIRFPHPHMEGKFVQFVLHNPHPNPNLYDALMERFIRNLSYYGLGLGSFMVE